MNNISKVLFHDISWFLENGDQKELYDSWEEDIKTFINEGYREGQFAVLDENDEEDFLTWRIL